MKASLASLPPRPRPRRLQNSADRFGLFHFSQLPLASLYFLLLSDLAAWAQSNGVDSDDVPPLRPPRPEIPASFWEQHEILVIAGAAVAMVLVGAGIWWLLRPKPPVIVPPDVTARQALGMLRNQPETGLVLMKTSQIIRSYFGTVYHLPRGEFTTTEFSRMIVDKGTVDPQLAAAVSDFLKLCDLRKFAPSAEPHLPLGAVTRASKLIDQAEAARAALIPESSVS